MDGDSPRKKNINSRFDYRVPTSVKGDRPPGETMHRSYDFPLGKEESESENVLVIRRKMRCNVSRLLYSMYSSSKNIRQYRSERLRTYGRVGAFEFL